MSMLHPFVDPRDVETSPPLKIVSGDGISVTDEHGKAYIDAVSGLWCASLGFSNKALIEAAEAQLNTLPFYHAMLGRTLEPTEALAKRLIDIAPDRFSRVFFGCSGSDAVETAVKMVWYYNNALGRPKKKRIIARQSAYHGSGLMSASLTGLPNFHHGFDLDNPLVLRAAFPAYQKFGRPNEREQDYSCRLAVELDQQINEAGPETIAAFIAEPVMSSCGVFPPPTGYWEMVQPVLEKHNILLIADETITGYCRTGQWFGSTTVEMHPDIMTTAKQLTGGYIPMSACFISDTIYQTVADAAHKRTALNHGFTYGGHPVAAAVAMEAINQYEQLDMNNRVQATGQHLRRRLLRLKSDFEVILDVRTIGLLAGVELIASSDGIGIQARHILQEAEKRGVLVRACDDTIALCPPLIATASEIDQIVDTLEESIRAIHRS